MIRINLEKSTNLTHPTSDTNNNINGFSEAYFSNAPRNSTVTAVDRDKWHKRMTVINLACLETCLFNVISWTTKKRCTTAQYTHFMTPARRWDIHTYNEREQVWRLTSFHAPPAPPTLHTHINRLQNTNSDHSGDIPVHSLTTFYESFYYWSGFKVSIWSMAH